MGRRAKIRKQRREAARDAVERTLPKKGALMVGYHDQATAYVTAEDGWRRAPAEVAVKGNERQRLKEMAEKSRQRAQEALPAPTGLVAEDVDGETYAVPVEPKAADPEPRGPAPRSRIGPGMVGIMAVLAASLGTDAPPILRGAPDPIDPAPQNEGE